MTLPAPATVPPIVDAGGVNEDAIIRVGYADGASDIRANPIALNGRVIGFEVESVAIDGPGNHVGITRHRTTNQDIVTSV